MKYFICALEKILLGIPAEQTERIMQEDRLQTAVRESENGKTFISLPALFKLKNNTAPHGVLLKSEEPAGTASCEEVVLLAPKIDIEIHVPEEDIHELPRVLDRQFLYLRGVYFSGQDAILMLDPEKLLESFND